MTAAIIHNHPIHYKHLLFSELKRQGLVFEVLFLGGQSSIRHEQIGLSERLYRSSIAWPGPYETAPAWRRGIFPWMKLCELSPDMVIISGYYAVECWSAWLWARVYRRPIILWFESNSFDYPRHWPKEFLKWIFCRQVRRAHVYGRTNKEYLIKLGIPAVNIDVKRAVADVERFALSQPHVFREPGRSRQLLYVGRLAPEKNLSFLLRAFALGLRGHDCGRMRLVIAGTGPCESALRSEAQALGIADEVEFLGYTPQKDLPGLYQSVDFFVLPSTREPWGLVTLEAMLARLPVLISTQCGCAMDVVTSANGWTFSPYCVEELAALIATLSAQATERLRAMGERSFAIARQYSAASCARIVIRSATQVFKEVRARQSGSRREAAA